MVFIRYTACGLHDDFQRVFARKFAGVRRQAKSKLDFIKRDAMRDQQMHRQFAAENQVGGLLLNIDRSAVGAEQRPLAHADAGAGKLDAFFVRSLREEHDFRAGTRSSDRFFDQAFDVGGDKDHVGAAAFGEFFKLCRRRSVARGSMANVAPQCFESSSRRGMVSVARIVQPRSFSSMVNSRPIGP